MVSNMVNVSEPVPITFYPLFYNENNELLGIALHFENRCVALYIKCHAGTIRTKLVRHEVLKQILINLIFFNIPNSSFSRKNHLKEIIINIACHF